VTGGPDGSDAGDSADDAAPPTRTDAGPVDASAHDAQLQRLAWVLQLLRTNDRFWPARTVAATAAAWVQARATAPLSVPLPQMGAATGLPTWRSWAALFAERALHRDDVAPPVVAEHVPAQDPRRRLLLRLQAQGLLAAAPLLASSQLQIQLRKVEETRRRVATRAFVTLVFDRIDSEGLLVRLTADLDVRQGGAAPIAVVAGADRPEERLTASAALETLLARVAVLPAWVLLLRLAELPDVTVERVTRGVVGPITTAGFGDPACAALLAGPHAVVAALRHEEVSPVLTATTDTDCLATDDLAAAVAALPTALRHHRAFRELRLWADLDSVAALSAHARSRGRRTLVNALRPPP
jgi:hypothetical protein